MKKIPFLGNWGILHFIENNGMAFGLSLPGIWGKLLLTSFRIVAVVAIGFYIRQLIRQVLLTAPGERVQI